MPAMGLVVLLLVGLGLRLAALPVPGHFGDVAVTARWAENMALFGPGHLDIPQRLSILCIDGDQAGVDGAHEERVSRNRDPAIHTSATHAGLG